MNTIRYNDIFFFKKYLQDLRLVRDKFTHVSRGFAFVHFHSVSLLFSWICNVNFLLFFYKIDGTKC